MQSENHRNRDKINAHSTHILDHSLSWRGKGTLIKSGDVKLDLWTLTWTEVKWKQETEERSFPILQIILILI